MRNNLILVSLWAVLAIQCITVSYVYRLKEIEVPKTVQVNIDMPLVAFSAAQEGAGQPYSVDHNFFYSTESSDVRTHELMQIFKKYTAEVCPEIEFVDLNGEYEKKWKSLEEK